MIILLHVVLALSSIISAGVLFFKPAKQSFYLTYLLVGGTLGTGTYLVWSTKASLAHSCVAGLIYLGVVFAGIIPAHFKLTSIKAKAKDN